MFFLGRPTEVTESDVYVCESLYEEAKRLVTKLLREGIKKYQHSGDVQDDEIYFFRRLISPAKVNTMPGVCLLCAIALNQDSLRFNFVVFHSQMHCLPSATVCFI
jgi:hypothetical protein